MFISLAETKTTTNPLKKIISQSPISSPIKFFNIDLQSGMTFKSIYDGN